jgi:hypothetical protein
MKKTKINEMEIENESKININPDLLVELQKIARLYL